MRDPESVPASIRVMLAHTPANRRGALEALFALDGRLGSVLASTSEPLIGQMRLTWWHDALIALDDASAPAEPVLRKLGETVVPCGIAGRDLATIIDGWEVLLEGVALDDAALLDFADKRGGRLFALAARLLGAPERMAEIGAGWALADLALRWSDPDTAARAAALALARLPRWRRSFAQGPLPTLALLAGADLRRAVPAPRRSIISGLLRRISPRMGLQSRRRSR